MRLLKSRRRIVERRCPACGKLVDGTSGVRTREPVPGDLCVCIYCAAVMQFGEALELVTIDFRNRQDIGPENRKMIEFLIAKVHELHDPHRRRPST